MFLKPPLIQIGSSSSQLSSSCSRQLIISQLASIMAWDPGLVIKNQRTEVSQLNDPKISTGFTGSGFSATAPGQKPSSLSSSTSAEGLSS